jgi:hypothetical protein
MTALLDNAAHVVITPEGGIYRYPRLSLAKAMWIDQSVVFTNPQQLIDRCSLHALNYYHKKLTGIDPGWRSKEVAAEKLWPVLISKAEPHNPFAKRHNNYEGKRAAKREEQTLLFAAKEYFDEASPKMATQAYVLGRYLAEHEPRGGYTWDGAEMTARQAHDNNVLKTRQDPVRIFHYYFDDLMRLGLVAITDKEGNLCDRPRNDRKMKGIVVRTPMTRDFRADRCNHVPIEDPSGIKICGRCGKEVS